MKSIKIVLLFACMYFALPTGYCITLPVLVQDSIKQKNKISNDQLFNAFELVQGITSTAAGSFIFWLGNGWRQTSVSTTASLGKLAMVLGALGVIVGVLLLVHFFIRQRKKKRGK